MDQYYTAIISALVMCIIWCIKISLNPARGTPPLPPGPRGLPILGYLPFLGNNLLHQFADLAQRYGPIYKLYLGNRLCVVINSPTLVKEVVRDQDSIFANRDANIAALAASYGGKDISFSPLNSDWRTMRKILVREVLSNNSLQGSYNLRKEEVRKAINRVYKDAGKPVHFGELSFRTELNVIMNLLWGGIVEGEECERVGEKVREVITKLVDLLGKPNIADFFPVLARFDIQGVKKEMKGYVQSMERIYDDVIARCRKMSSGEIKREGKKDFLQVLLELQEKEDPEMPISLRQIKAILMDVVGGGTDTSATTIEWVMTDLLNNPKAMEKVQKELWEVVGLNNIVEESHTPKLKYLDAVVKETMRLHPPVPLLVPRSPNKTSVIGGYTVPKGTRVFINVGWIQRDPSIWDSPSEFKPERFLHDNEKCDFSGNNFHYLPFGSGRRICPGLPLAEKMLMHLLASLLHSFEWKLPDGETVNMSGTFGIVLRKSTTLLAIPSPRLSEPNLYA
ncbi:cytochrome P450 76C1-like [Sesamum indicum]|uniref:Cytochrome P450 76C1-like n=1 Tax=Sesamum indicum TaxID=4182 RepID=A0A6I9SNM7_SESIN|nr:cytochrome P450 76C1-like [Sesamum indicum]